VWIDGQIDRIDLAPDGTARVVDYKTGVPREPTGLPIQLALYAAAVPRALAARGQETPRVTAEYVVLRSGRPIERKVAAAARGREDPDAWRAARADARTLARRAAHALSNGEIAPRPMTPSLCSRCEARDVCRRPAVMPHDDGEDR
jgi:RecB family exonuclease